MKIKALVLTMMMMFSIGFVKSQPPNPPPPVDGSTSAPIDNEALAMLFAVSCYGYFQVKKKESIL